MKRQNERLGLTLDGAMFIHYEGVDDQNTYRGRWDAICYTIEMTSAVCKGSWEM